MTFGASGRQRQNRVKPVEGLNRRFLIDREDGGVARVVQIQAQDIGGLPLEIRITGSM
jgi:hypothetical protein